MTDRTRSRSPRATIADVANLAGVAKSSVSNYLNGQIRLSDAMRDRIASAIAALDYRPTESARSLTARRRAMFDVSRLPPDLPCLTTVGHLSVDYVAQLMRLPQRGDRVGATEILKAVGGPAANVAAFAAALGPDLRVACSLVTSVGDDVDSDWAIAELGTRRVDVLTPSERRDGRLARALVMVEPSGHRTIVAEPLSVGELELDLFTSRHDARARAWCLHVEGFQVSRQMPWNRKAREAGFRTSMQTTGLAPDLLSEALEQYLENFDLLIIQRETLGNETPEAAAARLSALARQRAADGLHWPEAVFVSAGLQGLTLIAPDGQVTRADAPPDAGAPVDETGVSDAIAGTLLAVWLNGIPLAGALPAAVAAGALVATRFGAQELRPTLQDICALTGPLPSLPEISAQ